jgi:hypothetical protein
MGFGAYTCILHTEILRVPEPRQGPFKHMLYHALGHLPGPELELYSHKVSLVVLRELELGPVLRTGTGTLYLGSCLVCPFGIWNWERGPPWFRTAL